MTDATRAILVLCCVCALRAVFGAASKRHITGAPRGNGENWRGGITEQERAVKANLLGTPP